MIYSEEIFQNFGRTDLKIRDLHLWLKYDVNVDKHVNGSYQWKRRGRKKK